MRASPGTTHTFDIIPRHGCVRVIWPATGHGLDDYEIEITGVNGYKLRVLPGHHVMGALEWWAQPKARGLSFAAGERTRRVDRLMKRIRTRRGL